MGRTAARPSPRLIQVLEVSGAGQAEALPLRKRLDSNAYSPNKLYCPCLGLVSLALGIGFLQDVGSFQLRSRSVDLNLGALGQGNQP